MRCLPSCFALTCVFALSTSVQAAELLAPETPVEQAIDHYLDAKLAAAGVSPAPPADDANLLRRTMLDLIGRIPTATEARAFVAATEKDKREQLVERLMSSPAFVRQQAAEFDALLMEGTKASLRDYLLRAFQESRPWDQMFRDMLVGEPDDKKQQGAIRFVASRVRDQDKLTADTSSLFFGVNVSCAKCHDHPLVDDWKQDHYYGMLSFFSRTYEVGEFFGEREYGQVSFQTVEGASREAKLMFLTGEVLDEPSAAEPDEKAKKAEKQLLEELKKKKEPPPVATNSRRIALVETALADEKNEFLPRAIVNHVWNRLLGRGLVHPVDQMHSANPPSHPELLAWLARDMKAHGYDLRRLVRGIVLSESYGRASRWDSAAKRPADDLFAVAQVRPLKPWQYGTSLKLAAANPDGFSAESKPAEVERRLEGLESGGRSLGSTFELPTADFQVSVDEALLLSNADRIAQELLRDDGATLVSNLNKLDDHRAAAETAVWSVFSRAPTEDEFKSLTEYLAQRADRPKEARKQLVWALLTSSECRFNY
ncbi:MAG: DUF1549 domain-containing protein [Pirellulaceae bacterium]|nr:DUF1549 domain-containing protein [Pirellulaceae bacterium]